MKYLYIVGYPRTGSTLLGNVLNEHRSFFHAGEVCEVPEIVATGGLRRCGCGQEFRQCEFWSTVESTPEARLELGDLYERIYQRSGTEWVVDSSKDPHYLRELRSTVEFEAFRVLHLVRDPQASVHSMFRRRREKNDRDGRPQTPALDLARQLREALRWAKDARLGAALQDQRLDYEHFATDPESALEVVADLTGVDLSSAPPVVDKTVDLGTNHAVWGNRSRFLRGPVSIELDERWRREMSVTSKALVGLASRRASREVRR